MANQYCTKEQALERGLFYSGFTDSDQRGDKLDELLNSEPEEVDIGWPQSKTVEAHRFVNPGGHEVIMGVGQFRDGFDLWLLNPASSLYRRF